jgi:hypothetical protein
MKIKKLLSYEWDAIAGILAATCAIILHLLHIVDEHIVLPIILALMGLLFINFMRHTRSDDLTAEQIKHTGYAIEKIQSALKLPDVILIGPRQLRSVNERFFKQMKGDAVLFNVCLSMYKTQPLFDALLRPAIENSTVTSIQFILDERQKELWQEAVQPKIAACIGPGKVREPRWCHLSRNISFILADNHQSDGAEALLSFWGEPFMGKAKGKDVPRFIFHVQKHSELLPHLMELEHSCGHS